MKIIFIPQGHTVRTSFIEYQKGQQIHTTLNNSRFLKKPTTKEEFEDPNKLTQLKKNLRSLTNPHNTANKPANLKLTNPQNK